MISSIYKEALIIPWLLSQAAARGGPLSKFETWNTVDVDYEHPRVERLWTQLTPEMRVFLHRIHPCPDGKRPLFHPHPWASAVKVVSGRYFMELGYGTGETPPRVAATMILNAGSSYEMVNEDAWHSVNPIDEPSLSVMVTGARWNRWAPKPRGSLKPLSPTAAKEILLAFIRCGDAERAARATIRGNLHARGDRGRARRVVGPSATPALGGGSARHRGRPDARRAGRGVEESPDRPRGQHRSRPLREPEEEAMSAKPEYFTATDWEIVPQSWRDEVERRAREAGRT